MPWMPEVFTAPIAEARRAEEAALTNDAVPYYEGIRAEEPDPLIRSFAGEPRISDPRVGHVEGTRKLRAFVSGMGHWLRERGAVVENVALTRTQTRTVEEIVLHLLGDDGGRIELPVAIATDRKPDRMLKAIRVYHSMWPLTGEHAIRPPLLPADPELHAEGVVGDYQKTLAEGDLEGIVGTFEADGYAREPSGGAYMHRGAEGLRELYAHLFANDGGISLEHCTLTDDGVRCAIEYNCVRWGKDEVPPQAGVAVYERGGSGLLSAARIYDDVDPPA
ncbi:MAG: nuclear transport factor 2 family protein, partial [Actinomycetota bacterium]|nr:nuclear transport factor 2 family protein [Actinomycetota bacterium]